jgi:hypothetical protein
MKNYIRTVFLLLACISNNVWAQSRPISADQKALNDNFKMTYPTDKTDISKPFGIEGYGVPGAKVEIHITPISQGGKGTQFVSVLHGKQNPYKVQNYTATVASDGSWKLPENITVKFNEGATGRRIHVFAGQSKDGLVSKKPVNREIKLKDDPVFVVTGGTIKTDNIKITSHVDGDQANGLIQIKGTGKPGTVFLVSLVAWAYVTAKSGLLTGKGPEGYSRNYYKNHKVTVDKNGNWEIPAFQQHGNTEWIRQLFIVTGWTVKIGPLSPKDSAFPEKSKNYIRLICNEKYRDIHMRETERERNN